MVFLTHPISAALLLIAILLVRGPMLLHWRNWRKGAVSHEAV